MNENAEKHESLAEPEPNLVFWVLVRFGSVRVPFQKFGSGSVQSDSNRTEPNLSGSFSVLVSSTHSTKNQIYSKNDCFLVGSASFDRCFDGSGRVWFG